MNQVNAAKIKKSVEGFNSSNETFLVWQKRLRNFQKISIRKFKNFKKRGTGRTLIIEQNDKKERQVLKKFSKV